MNDFEAGKKLLCGNYSAYTPTGKSYFVKAGRWSKTPHVGDVVYFYSSSLGRVAHVGIVVDVQFSNGLYHIGTYEGNTNAGVLYERDGGEYAYKTYEFLPSQVGGANRINGFGTPMFGADTCSAEQFVLMASTQKGYIEKKSNKDLESFTANIGSGNFTKYGKWYSEITGEKCYLNGQWCQMSVSWIAYHACIQARQSQTGWVHQDDGSWMYWKPDGVQVIAEWAYIEGRWYVFDGSGRMIKGWFKSGLNDWYMLGEDGGMLSGQWIMDDGKSYYLTRSGLMAKNAYIRSDKPFAPGKYIYYWVNNRGEWEPKWDTEKPDLSKYELAY